MRELSHVKHPELPLRHHPDFPARHAVACRHYERPFLVVSSFAQCFGQAGELVVVVFAALPDA